MKIVFLFAITLAFGLPSFAQTASAQCNLGCQDATPNHTVVLVHGKAFSDAEEPVSNFDSMVAYMEGRGYDEGANLFRIDLETYCGDNFFCSELSGYNGDSVYDSYALCLAEYIDDVAPCTTTGHCGNQTTTCPQVDLVGHSAGTIVAKHYVRFIAPEVGREVNDLVMIASPQNGVVNCLCTTCLEQCEGIFPDLCPDSDYLRLLNGVAPQGDGSNDETPGADTSGEDPTNYTAITSAADLVVNPFCSGVFIENPDTMQADTMVCQYPRPDGSFGNYVDDPDATHCQFTGVQAPTHTLMLNNVKVQQHTYCELNRGE